MPRYCFALDLKDDDALIEEYETHHRAVWPEVRDSFYRAGITDVELYRTGNRLFMILDTTDDFSLAKKSRIDSEDPIVQKWETLMGTYQQPLPWAGESGKWVLMKRIYKFNQ